MYLDPVDLVPFATIPEAKAQAMIADAEAMATSVAPCLVSGDPMTPEQVAAIRAILRRAVLRWHETGTGMVTQQSAGPFQQSIDTTRSAPRGLFWPSEIAELQGICRQVTGEGGGHRAFSVDTTPATSAPGWWQRPDLWFQYGTPDGH